MKAQAAQSQTPSNTAAGEPEWIDVTPGERFVFRVSSKDTDGAYFMLEVIADPRYGVPLHVHDNEEEHFIIVQGSAHMAVGDRRLDAEPGMSVTVAKGVPHAWCNLSDAPLRMLVLFTPGHIEELFRATGRENFDLATTPARYGTRIIGPALREDVYSILSPRP
jgi:mannose-6-phosphate isomerase-like protein (cupin superfamily)